VGAGTFQPVRTERIEAHRMHAERLEVPAAACEAVAEARARGGRVVAVGTTVVRALESAAVVHLPRSTLLMLVCAFGGRERVLRAYRHAVAARYRFYSYGDAMLLFRAPGAGEGRP